MGRFVKCLGVLGFMAMAVLMIVGIVEARMLEKEAFELELGGRAGLGGLIPGGQVAGGGGGAGFGFGFGGRAGGAAPGPGLGAGGFGFGGRAAGGAAPGPGLGAGVGGAGLGFRIGGGF